ncbi:MAG: hypothetical protein PVI88_00205 [Nitrosopumilaceae archaeon]|jgi:hypothetical protein
MILKWTVDRIRKPVEIKAKGGTATLCFMHKDQIVHVPDSIGEEVKKKLSDDISNGNIIVEENKIDVEENKTDVEENKTESKKKTTKKVKEDDEEINIKEL